MQDHAAGADQSTAWPVAPGEMAARIRHHDWAATPLGPAARWPVALRTLLDMMLASPLPMVVAWGPDLTMFYNDAYRPLLGRKPEALGRPMAEVWEEAMDILGPLARDALADRPGAFRAKHFVLTRNGQPEDTYFDFSLSPVRDETGTIRGLLNTAVEVTDRVLTTRRLHESEAQARAVLEQMDIGVAIAAVPSGELLYHNAKALELLGHPLLSSADHRGYTRYGALHADGAPYTAGEYPIAHTVLTGETVQHHVMRYRRGDGALTWLDVSAAPVQDATGKPVLAVSTFWDIAAKHAAEIALRESEERFRAVAEQAEVGVAMADHDMVVTYANDRFCQISQRRREEVVGLPIAAMTHADDWPGKEALLRRTLDTGAPFTAEQRRPLPDGSTIWVRNTVGPRRDAEGRIIGTVVVSVDISDRRAAEERLRENERRLRTLIEGVPQLVWRAGRGGERIWSSPQWTAFTGLTQEASLGMGWLAALHPDDRQDALAAWQRADATGGFSTECRIGRAGGEGWRWFRVETRPVRDEAGGLLEWLGTSTDIDDLRRMQDQQEVMVAELQHRTRNLIAIVQSIAHQTLAMSDDMATFGDEFSARLSALSRVQGLLSSAEHEPVTIGTLVAMELGALGADRMGDRVRSEGPSVPLRTGAVQTLALGLHELATNARKHGALAAPDGCLAVTWRTCTDDDGRSRLYLEWIESGLVLPQEHQGTSRRGYGRRLIERALPYALGARTRFELTRHGLRCTIDLPLARHGDTELAG